MKPAVRQPAELTDGLLRDIAVSSTPRAAPAEIEARLKADKGGTIKAVMVAQIDTASGVVNDIPAIDWLGD
jgi:aspartate aminotransferase-like enzyme